MAKKNIGSAGSVKGSSGSFVDGFTDISYDQDYDIINSYNFMLRVEGIFSLGVRSVRGIDKKNEFEYVQEGGLNDYVHMLRKPISQPFTFQVERYVSQDWLEDFFDPLALGTEFILPLILYINRLAKSDGRIPVRYYIFTNARVIGTQVGDLDAEKSGLHTVTYTIAYANMISFTIPIAALTTTDEYKFNNNNAPNLENKSARNYTNLGLSHTAVDVSNYDPKNPDAFLDSILETAKQNPRSTRTKFEMMSLSRDYTKTLRKAKAEDDKEKKEIQKGYDEKNNVPRKYVVNEKAHEGDKSTQSAVSIPNNETKAQRESKAKKYIVNPARHPGMAVTKSAVYADGDGEKAGFKSKAQANTAKLRAKYKEDLEKSDAQHKAAYEAIGMPRIYPDTESAVHPGSGKDPEQRLYPDDSSAVKPQGGSAPKQRLYPKTPSAERPKGGRNPQGRVYPKTSSAIQPPKGQDPVQRIYPPTRSARQVSEFLSGR